jgi:hypothetical protein
MTLEGREQVARALQLGDDRDVGLQPRMDLRPCRNSVVVSDDHWIG